MKRSVTKSMLVALVVLLATGVLLAQSFKTSGVINGRAGNTMTLQTDAGNVTVVLTANTDVQDVNGIFHAKKKQMGLTALVPGLEVQVQGSYNAQHQIVAEKVTFNGKSLQTATDIQAGVAPAQQQLAQQQQQLQAQQQALKAEQEQQAADEAKIAANKAAIAAVNKRFGELGEYNIWDEATVLFANGEVNVEAKYYPQLQALAKKAVTVNGYVIQVQGYASKVGSAALNQKLSQERAQNVINYLEQQCGIPLTNVLAPGAMGTADQVAPDNTAEGQADNRRVVVRVLQNKGIAGN